MFICKECGTLYEDEHRPYFEDKVPYGETYMTIREYVCVCGGDLAPALKCIRCGDYVDAEELAEDMCEDCQQELNKDARAVMIEHFSVDELIYLREHTEEWI